MDEVVLRVEGVEGLVVMDGYELPLEVTCEAGRFAGGWREGGSGVSPESSGVLGGVVAGVRGWLTESRDLG